MERLRGGMCGRQRNCGRCECVYQIILASKATRGAAAGGRLMPDRRPVLSQGPTAPPPPAENGADRSFYSSAAQGFRESASKSLALNLSRNFDLPSPRSLQGNLLA
jgi:hypothetical protein